MDCTLGQEEGTGLSDTDLNYDTALTARRAHPGGVNALMMDGSVRSIKSSIQLTVWRSLGTRSGGEVLDSSY
jgi:prepilin-type processing-associated H-X9-DG protein